MNKVTKLNQNQNGAVALITVILLMFIFLLVTLGFLRASINEQRNASDTDLKSRAYYAAESGVEDAKRILNRFYADGDLTLAEAGYLRGSTCDSASPSAVVTPQLSVPLDTEVTCQLIDVDTGDFIANLGINQSVFIPLIPAVGAAGDVDRVLIEWHDDDENGPAVGRNPLFGSLPNIGCWNNGESGACSGSEYPAMLRAGLFGHTDAGAVTRADINNNNRVSYLNPNTGGPGFVTVSAFETKSGDINVISKSSNCSGAGTYLCQLEVRDLSGVNYLRLSALYRSTNIRVTMYNAAGDVLDFDGAQAKIDVTARAGDVIRRIEARIPLLRSTDVLPDEAITTAEQLCKVVTIETATSATDRCPTAPPPTP